MSAGSKDGEDQKPWTDEEQKRLEDGLVKFAIECDLRKKWQAIASHVGSRGPKACAERYKECRARALRANAGDTAVPAQGRPADHSEDDVDRERQASCEDEEAPRG